jgi:hypothetical protein
MVVLAVVNHMEAVAIGVFGGGEAAIFKNLPTGRRGEGKRCGKEKGDDGGRESAGKGAEHLDSRNVTEL